MLPLRSIEDLLENWAAWCNSDCTKLGYPPPPMFRLWRPNGDARDPGWGDEEAAPEPTGILINVRQAEALDGLLLCLERRQWKRIRRRYLYHAQVDRLELDQALRCLSDLIENRPKAREELL